MPVIFCDRPRDNARLSDLDKTILLAAATRAGVPELHITRTAATPEQQALVMYNNCAAFGARSQLQLYGSAGDQVVRIFEERQEDPKQDVVAAMLAKILEIGPESVSHHCVSDWSRLHVIDISSVRIQRDCHLAFDAALGADHRISRHFSPYTLHKDPAFHVEIPQA